MTQQPSSKQAGARSAWIGVGAPIFGLVLVTIMLSVAMLAGVAREQDRTNQETTRRLVLSALAGGEQAVRAATLEYTEWQAAYEATKRWDEPWIEENIYSSALDAMIVVRADGDAPYAWFNEPFEAEAETLRAPIVEAAMDVPSLHRLVHAPTSAETVGFVHANVGGRLLLISIAPFIPEDEAERLATRGPQTYLIAVEVLDPAKIERLGETLTLEDFAFISPEAPTGEGMAGQLVRGPNGAPIGQLVWRDARPGSASFTARLWPVVFALLVVGVLAVLIARLLVTRQIAVAADAQAAFESSRAKSEFLTRVTHELRTPLNAIIGYAEIIQEENEDATTRTDAERIVAAARHLSTLLNDIIDQSRLDADRIKLHTEVLPVAGMLAEVQGLIGPAAKAAKVTLNVAADPLAGFVVADHVRLRQCLLNLIGNAIKFSPGGAVSVRAQAADAMVVFEVRDTGIGIARKDIDNIFRPFGQANASISKTFGGTGLGLSISRELARAMGGDISVESEFGEGSTFRLTIPAATAQALKAA